MLGIPLLARAPVYDVSSGVLLSRNLHHRYDRLEWSFFYHVRTENETSQLAIHQNTHIIGQRVLRALFRDIQALGPPWQGYTRRFVSREVPLAASKSEAVRMALRAVRESPHTWVPNPGLTMDTEVLRQGAGFCEPKGVKLRQECKWRSWTTNEIYLFLFIT